MDKQIVEKALEARKLLKLGEFKPEEMPYDYDNVAAFYVGCMKDNKPAMDVINQIKETVENTEGLVSVDYDEAHNFSTALLGPGADKPIEVKNENGKIILIAFLSCVRNNTVDEINLNLTWYDPQKGLINKKVRVPKWLNIREIFSNLPLYPGFFPVEMFQSIIKVQEKCKLILEDMDDNVDDPNDFMCEGEYDESLSLSAEEWMNSTTSPKKCPYCKGQMIRYTKKGGEVYDYCQNCEEEFYG